MPVLLLSHLFAFLDRYGPPTHMSDVVACDGDPDPVALRAAAWYRLVRRRGGAGHYPAGPAGPLAALGAVRRLRSGYATNRARAGCSAVHSRGPDRRLPRHHRLTLGLAHLPIILVIIAIAAQALLASQLGLALGSRTGATVRERAEQLAGLGLLALGSYLIIHRALA